MWVLGALARGAGGVWGSLRWFGLGILIERGGVGGGAVRGQGGSSSSSCAFFGLRFRSGVR